MRFFFSDKTSGCMIDQPFGSCGTPKRGLVPNNPCFHVQTPFLVLHPFLWAKNLYYSLCCSHPILCRFSGAFCWFKSNSCWSTRLFLWVRNQFLAWIPCSCWHTACQGECIKQTALDVVFLAEEWRSSGRGGKDHDKDLPWFDSELGSKF